MAAGVQFEGDKEQAPMRQTAEDDASYSDEDRSSDEDGTAAGAASGGPRRKVPGVASTGLHNGDLDVLAASRSASSAETNAPIVPPIASWSTIGDPGFQYERLPTDSARSKRPVQPTPVTFTATGTPRYCFDRKAGASWELERMTRPVESLMLALENAIETDFKMDEARRQLRVLEAGLGQMEAGLYKSQKGRVFFIQLRSFIFEMRKLLKELRAFDVAQLVDAGVLHDDASAEEIAEALATVDNVPDGVDPGLDRADEIYRENVEYMVKLALARNQKWRAVTDGPSRDQLETSRSYAANCDDL